MSQLEYMKLMPFIEPVFYDDMGTADSIIKAIQTYQEDENFVPKVKNLPNKYDLEMNPAVIFTIDSATMDVNYNVVHYDIELIAESTKIGFKYLHEYRIKVSAKCKLPDKEPISLSGYSLITRDVYDVIQFIEKGMFDKMVCNILGNVAWRIQRYCLKEAKNYIVKVNDENWRLCGELEQFLAEPPKPFKPNTKMEENENDTETER